jgi:hypothetical protein
MPEFFTPNMQMWAGVLDKKQKEDEAMDALLAKMPRHIETQEYKERDPITGEWVPGVFGDTEAKEAYVQKIEDWKSKLTEAALKGDKKEYTRLMLEAQRDINKDWAPGGAAETMEKRLEEHTANLAAINEAASKDIQYSAENLPYAMSRYRKQVGQLKPGERGKYIGKANIYPFLDVQKTLNEYTKSMGFEEGTVQEVGIGPNGEYEVKRWGKSVSPERQREITNFLNSPQFAQQLAARKFTTAQSLAVEPEELLANANDKIRDLKKLDNAVVNYRTKINNQQQPSEDETKLVYAILDSQGFIPENERINAKGDINKLINIGLSNFREGRFNEFTDLGQYLDYSNTERMTNISKGLLGKERGYAENWDAFYLAQKRYGWDAALIDLKESYSKLPEIGTFWGGTDIEPDPENAAEQMKGLDASLKNAEDSFSKLNFSYISTDPRTAVAASAALAKNGYKTQQSQIDFLGDAIMKSQDAKTPDELRAKLKQQGVPDAVLNSTNLNTLFDDLKSNVYQTAYNDMKDARAEAENYRAAYEEKAVINLDKDFSFNETIGHSSAKPFNLQTSSSYTTYRSIGNVSDQKAPDYYKNVLSYNVNGEKYVMSKADAEVLFADDYNSLTDYQKAHRDAVAATISKKPEAASPMQKIITTTAVKGELAESFGVLEEHFRINRSMITGNKTLSNYADEIEGGTVNVVVNDIGIGSGGVPVVGIKLFAKDGGEIKLDKPVYVPLSELTVTHQGGLQGFIQPFFQDIHQNRTYVATDDDKFNAGRLAFYYQTGKPLVMQNTASQKSKGLKERGQKELSTFSQTVPDASGNLIKFNWKLFAEKGPSGKTTYVAKKWDGAKYVTIENSRYDNIEATQSYMGYAMMKPEYVEQVRISLDRYSDIKRKPATVNPKK